MYSNKRYGGYRNHYNVERSNSAPVERNTYTTVRVVDSVVMHKLNSSILPDEIKEYNKNVKGNIFICPYEVKDLLDFKNRNISLISSLKNNPTMDTIILEYKLIYKRKLRAEFNKLKLTDTRCATMIEFIRHNQILSDDDIIDHITHIIEENIRTSCPIAIKMYCSLLTELKKEFGYVFNFVFDKDFLIEYYSLENIDIKVFLTNLIQFIITLKEKNVVDNKTVFIFFDAFIKDPYIPDNIDYNSYCRYIYILVHGLVNVNNGRSVLFESFAEYINICNYDVIEMINKLSVNSKGYWTRELITIIQNIRTNNTCCKDCELIEIKRGIKQINLDDEIAEDD